MKEYWKKWLPTIDVARKYYITKLVENNDGLHLLLVSTDDKSKIKIEFPGYVHAHRYTEELAARSTIEAIRDERGELIASDWTFFIVENSAYARKIEVDSSEIYTASQLIHFAVVASDSLVEVITYLVPEIFHGWD